MKELTFEEIIVEDMKLLPLEDLLKKTAQQGLTINEFISILIKTYNKVYLVNYRTAIFKVKLKELLTEHAPNFTAKEMSYLTNHTLGTLILEDKYFKK